jgi:hypothetical protein
MTPMSFQWREERIDIDRAIKDMIGTIRRGKPVRKRRGVGVGKIY